MIYPLRMALVSHSVPTNPKGIPCVPSVDSGRSALLGGFPKGDSWHDAIITNVARPWSTLECNKVNILANEANIDFHLVLQRFLMSEVA